MQQSRREKSMATPARFVESRLAADPQCWADRKEMRQTPAQQHARWPVVVFLATGALIPVGSSCRRDAQPHPRTDDALYAAEAGAEFAEDRLALICQDPKVLPALQHSAVDHFVPLPGYETPLREIYGHTLPGGATVTITVYAGQAPATTFLLRSWGHSSVEDKFVEARTTCEQLKDRKVHS
jgi:hypothetical protein